MAIVRRVKMAADEVVDMIAVRYSGMAGARSVDVSRLVRRTFVIGRRKKQVPTMPQAQCQRKSSVRHISNLAQFCIALLVFGASIEART